MREIFYRDPCVRTDGRIDTRVAIADDSILRPCIWGQSSRANKSGKQKNNPEPFPEGGQELELNSGKVEQVSVF